MSIPLSTNNLDVAEQVNVLFKSSMGFPSTLETKPWYDETSVKYNNYVNGEDIFVEEIPDNPTGWTSVTLSDISLNSNQLSTGGEVTEESTGIIRYYKRLILTAIPNSNNNSYYALDSDGNNILADGLQFNTKWSGSGPKPYPYTLNTQNAISADSTAPNELLQDSTGGNWMYDVRSGIIFFPDYSSSLCNNSSN